MFVVVAELASFIAASRRLAMPTSSVSRAVARLEEQLGVPLLRRTSRKVTVTDEGRQLLLGAAPHVEGLGEALALAADRRAELTGAVRVTAPAHTGATRIAQALAAFAAEHPGITIELDTSNTLHDLVRDGFDFAVRVGEGLNADVIARRLWRGQLGLFASREFVRRELRGRRTVTREQLERTPCVVMRASSVWRFDGPDGRTIEVSPLPRFAVNDPRAVVEVASRGLGIALTPVDAAAPHARTLVPLQVEFGEPQPIDLFIVYPTRRLLPQRIRAAIEWLATRG